jgi:hypothetical protein
VSGLTRYLALCLLLLTPSPSQAAEPLAWPPEPITPFVTPALAGEGVFTAPGADVVLAEAGERPAIMTTSLRTAARGHSSMAYVVAWDPRRVELRMRPGARNPVPAKGPRGDGLIPRDRTVASRLLGAFNGGFLTEDITSCDGMTVDGHEYTPVTPRGGTVALLKDGRTAFGTWPKDAPVPPDVVSLRQNMVPFMEGGVVDPLSRKRWGGTVDVAYAVGDKTVRTALCWVRGGPLLYVYLSFADPKLLGEVLTRARCDYAIHLDMNPGHTTFEFYRPLAAAEVPTDPKGVRELDTVRVQATPLVEKLRKTAFPRYLDKASSDFFYLVSRAPTATVPSPPVVPLFAPAPR